MDRPDGALVRLTTQATYAKREVYYTYTYVRYYSLASASATLGKSKKGTCRNRIRQR